MGHLSSRKASSGNPTGALLVFTIYCHTHTASGRHYVGLTKKTMVKRWHEHVHQANRRSRGRSHFHNAIRAYGPSSFSHDILERCYSVQDANTAEEYWVELLETRDPEKGFNLLKGGAHQPHPVRNPWDRPDFRERGLAFLAKANDISPEERSARSKAIWQDPSFADKVVSATKATKATPEGKARTSAAVKEWRNRPGMREKYSDSMREQWVSGPRREIAESLWKDPVRAEACSVGLRRGAGLNAAKTHCRNGHEYSPENTRTDRRGSRLCVACVRANAARNARRYRAGKRSAA